MLLEDILQQGGMFEMDRSLISMRLMSRSDPGIRRGGCLQSFQPNQLRRLTRILISLTLFFASINMSSSQSQSSSTSQKIFIPNIHTKNYGSVITTKPQSQN